MAHHDGLRTEVGSDRTQRGPAGRLARLAVHLGDPTGTVGQSPPTLGHVSAETARPVFDRLRRATPVVTPLSPHLPLWAATGWPLFFSQSEGYYVCHA
jgi:hypothetical protein